MLRTGIITYNQTAINNWSSEVLEIPGKISDQETIIRDCNETLRSIQAQLTQLRAIKATTLTLPRQEYLYQQKELRGRLVSLENSRNSNLNVDSQRVAQAVGKTDSTIQVSHLQVRTLQTHTPQQLSLINDEIEKVRRALNETDRQVQRYEAQIRTFETIQEIPLLVKIQTEKGSIRYAEATIRGFRERREWLHHHIAAAKEFLSNLANAPEQLVRNWIDEIRDNLKEYDQNDYMQSASTRSCLHDYEHRLEILLTQRDIPEEDEPSTSIYPQLHPTLEAPSATDETAHWHKKYLQIAGYLWNMYNIDIYPKDDSFQKVIFELLQMGHIDKHGDLPDQMATGITCGKAFADFTETQPHELFDMSIETFLKKENQAHANAMASLEAFSQAPNNPMQTLAKKLHEEISKELINLTPNRKLYTEIANLAVRITQPKLATAENVERFMSLASNVPGQPSLPKKIAGIMLGMVGLTIISLSLAAMSSSFGYSAPISIKGITIGATMMSQSLSTAGFTLSAATTYGAYRLFNSSKRHGMSQTMHQYQETILRPGLVR